MQLNNPVQRKMAKSTRTGDNVYRMLMHVMDFTNVTEQQLLDLAIKQIVIAEQRRLRPLLHTFDNGDEIPCDVSMLDQRTERAPEDQWKLLPENVRDAEIARYIAARETSA